VSSSPEGPEPTLAELLHGLGDDARVLMRQELAMARHEVLGELRKGQAALIAVGVGIGIAPIGGWLLLMMGVHLLQARTTLPLWACEGIGGGGLLLLGTIFVYRGRRQIVSVHVVPRQTVAAIRENLRWIREKVNTSKR
jgi:Putative Actinobacterial Holin-X, holin superfamily III